MIDLREGTVSRARHEKVRGAGEVQAKDEWIQIEHSRARRGGDRHGRGWLTVEKTLSSGTRPLQLFVEEVTPRV